MRDYKNYKSNKKYSVLYHNIRILYNIIKDFQSACHKYDVIFCSETLVSDRWHVSEIFLPRFNKPTLLLRDVRPRIHFFATYIREVFSCNQEGKCLYMKSSSLEFAVNLIISISLVFTEPKTQLCMLKLNLPRSYKFC